MAKKEAKPTADEIVTNFLNDKDIQLVVDYPLVRIVRGQLQFDPPMVRAVYRQDLEKMQQEAEALRKKQAEENLKN